MLIDVYKNAYLSNSESIFWGGETWIPIWDNMTLYLYVGIVAVIWWFSSIINSRKDSFYNRHINRRQNRNFKSPLLNACFIILLIFMAFRGTRVGIDTISYMLSFEAASNFRNAFAGNTEPLYNLFLFSLRSVFVHQQIPIIAFSLFIIYFVYTSIKRYYFDIDIVISLITFVVLYYFQSFNLIRITISASFLLWSFPLLLHCKYKEFGIRIIIASLIHYSSIVLFFPLLLLILYKKNKKITAILVLGIIFAIGIFANILQDYISIFERYSSYISDNESSARIGLSLFIDYLPCLYIVYYIISRNVKGEWSNLMIVFTISAFIIRLLAYYIIMAGRLHTHFMILTVLLLPYWICYIKRNDYRVFKLLYPFCFIWIFLRLHMYFKSFLSIDGIMPYVFFWN